MQPSIGRAGDRCRKCGCEQQHACVDLNGVPCHWVTSTLCSHCFDEVEAYRPGMKLYEAVNIDGQFSIVIRRAVVGRTDRGHPKILRLESQALIRRPELVADPKNYPVEIAASILADCLSESIARELAGLFVQDCIRSAIGDSSWSVNECFVRHWAAENKVPY